MKYITSDYSIDIDDMFVDRDQFDAVRSDLAAEIDWEIISEMLVSMGWTRVNLAYHHTKQPAVNLIEDWVSENIQGTFKFHGNRWIFDNEKDAALFALRWVDG